MSPFWKTKPDHPHSGWTSRLVGCQALLCADAAGCCLVGPGHEVAGCGILGGPGASAGSLVGRVRVPKTLGLLPTHWQVKPDPGVSASLMTGRAGSWSLASGPQDHRACFRSLWGWGWGWGWGGGAAPATVGYGAQGV